MWFPSVSTKQNCDPTFSDGVVQIETFLSSLGAEALANLLSFGSSVVTG